MLRKEKMTLEIVRERTRSLTRPIVLRPPTTADRA